jgi:hypothetical protein
MRAGTKMTFIFKTLSKGKATQAESPNFIRWHLPNFAVATGNDGGVRSSQDALR